MAGAGRELYVSTDIEADGPIPGPHSMLSLGSAVFLPDKTRIATFESNLEALPGAMPHPATMKWWEGFPAAWEACRRDVRPPEEVMRDYCDWLEALPGRPVFVAYPAGFDFTFVRWYLMRFTGRCPFGFAALDVKSFAMAVLGTRFRETTKRAMPQAWFDSKRHAHRALDDAIEQGELFCNMLAAHRGEAFQPSAPGPSCELVGTDDERLSLRVEREADGALATRVQVAVGGLSGDVVVEMPADELIALWMGAREVAAGACERVDLTPGSRGFELGIVARSDDTFAVGARVRDPEGSGQELSVSFVLDSRALEEAVEGLARMTAAHPDSGTELWD